VSLSASDFRVLAADAVASQARSRGPVAGFLQLSQQVPGRARRRRDVRYAQSALGLTDHLAFALGEQVRKHEAGEGPPPQPGQFDSIPFHDLCYGLLLPLEGLAPARAKRLFGLAGPGRLDAKGRRALVTDVLGREGLGLDLLDKVALVRGDPFLGRRVNTSLNVLLDVLSTVVMASPTALRDELARIGDVQELFVRHCSRHRSDPALTTREVLYALRHLKATAGRAKRAVLRSLLERMGRLETFFLVGFLRQGSRVSQTLGDDALIGALAEVTGAARDRLDVARSLVDLFELTRLLAEEGAEGLASLALRPLSPVGPMLAGAEIPKDLAFPVFFEKKYDGVRLMVHKAQSAAGRVRAAAFTRRRLEWTEQLPGLLPLCWALPCREAIVDGELHGFFFSQVGPRPASVYDVLKAVRGEGTAPLRLRFAAFDLLYLDGRDLTGLPLHERRRLLEGLVAPASLAQLPLPVELSDGERVDDRPSMMRLYNLFRSQGYEGGIAKTPAGPYELGRRSDAWTKLKPAITLDLAVTGALYTTSASGPGATFGAYLVSALAEGPSLQEVGRVQGLGTMDSARLMQAILDEGLLTGRRLEQETSSGRKAGVELRPGIVATVRFEGVVKDDAGKLSLRDPKILRIRTGEKDLGELDRVRAIDELFLKQRLR
jgi:DNA ligase-1